MRFFIELAALLAVVSIPAAVVTIVLRSGRDGPLSGRRRRMALTHARWQAESRAVEDRTIVAVARSIPAGTDREVLGEMVIAEIPAADPEWDIKVSQAMLDARVRADILNQENAGSG